MVIVRSTLQHITNQQTADIVSKPAFTPDSVLDLEKGTPSQCEAIRSVCRASYVAGFIHSQHALYSYTLHAVLLEIHLRWLLHVTPTTKPFIVVVFHGKSNGCLVRWKLHTPFCSSRTLLVLQWPIYCSCFPWNLKWCLAKINKSNGYLANCIHLFLPCWTMKHPELTKSSLYNFLHASKSLESTDVNFTYPPLKFVTACFCCAGKETWWLIHDCLPQVTAKPIR